MRSLTHVTTWSLNGLDGPCSLIENHTSLNKLTVLFEEAHAEPYRKIRQFKKELNIRGKKRVKLIQMDGKMDIIDEY